MGTTTKEIFFSVLILCIYAVYPSQGALYGPEQQKMIVSRLHNVIDYQLHITNTLPPESRILQSFHRIDDELINTHSKPGSLVAKILDNFFVLNSFPEIEKFMITEFRRKDIGKPFISHIKLNEIFQISVVSDVPKTDQQLDRSSKSSLVSKVLESKEGIRHFDQQFNTYIYRLAYDRGLMVVRGKYIFVDADLNGVPEALYFMGKYQDSRRNFHTYARVVAEGEDVLKNTAYHDRYLDSLYLVMDYILENYPFEQYERQDDYAQAL